MSYTRFGAALLAALSLAACGGGSTSTADKAPTKAAGETAAKAINLTTSDLPTGFTGEPSDSAAEDTPQEVAFAACVGASKPTEDLVDVSSDDFGKGGQLDLQQVSSDVSIVASADVAKKDLAAYQGSKTEACLTTFVTELLAEQTGGGEVTFGPPTIAKLATEVDGTDGGFGYTVTTTATAAGIEIPFELAIQGFLYKHTAISLTTLAIGKPFPTDVRTELLGTLVDRTKAKAV